MTPSGCGQPKSKSARVGKLYLFISLSLCLMVLFPPEASPQFRRAPSVHSVRITGNQRVEESTIRFYLKTKAGDKFSIAAIRDDIHKLYSLGFFEDIMVDVEEFEGQLIVTFMLREKPSIGKITIAGAEKISQEDIYKVITVKPNTIINKKQIHDSLEKVKSLYEEKGYYFARVDYEIQERAARKVDVLFKIIEGGKHKIKEIQFKGNEHLSDRQLKKVMETKETSLWRTIITFGKAGRLVKSKLETDTRRISTLYSSYGFIEAEVKKPIISLSKKREGIIITLTVVEGKQYKVGGIDIITDGEFPMTELRKAFDFNEGDIFNGLALPDKVRELTEYYTERGYAFADVDPIVNRRPEEQLVNLNLRIDKGARVHFRRVDIRGNERTRDKVIRRELTLQEGALYDSSQIKKSRARLQRLDYFSEVEIASQKRPLEDVVDLEVRVKEKQTGSFSGGGGFSSQQGAFAVGRVTQRNLFGKGWIISGEGIIGAERTDIIFSFTEPYFLDTRLSTTMRLADRFQDFDTFDIDTFSGALILGYPLSENLIASLGYSYEENELTALRLTSQARQTLRVEEGLFVTSALLPSITYHTLDKPLEPSRGLQVSFKNKLAPGFLGSDTEYYRGTLETRYYRPVPRALLPLRIPLTLMLRNVLGYAQGFGGDELPIYERFFLGGSGSLRGFSFRDVGPRDEFGRPLGGTSSFLFSTEISFPMASIVEALFFFDTGNVYLEGDTLDLTDLRYSVGPGLRARTPFGPISVSWGYKLDRRAGEKSGEFHFDVGTGF